MARYVPMARDADGHWSRDIGYYIDVHALSCLLLSNYRVSLYPACIEALPPTEGTMLPLNISDICLQNCSVEPRSDGSRCSRLSMGLRNLPSFRLSSGDRFTSSQGIGWSGVVSCSYI